MPNLLEALATALERPREISPQVVKHLVGTYGIERDEIAAFLVEKLPNLEEYQIDLVLSPLFTPMLSDQAIFAELLGRDSVLAEQRPQLVQQLMARPTHAHLLTDANQAHSIPLPEVVIERYVNRLRLDGTIAEPIFKLITSLLPQADGPMLKAVARRAIWDSGARGKILLHFLSTSAGNDAYRLEDVQGLLRLVEAYEPADAAELRARLPQWQEVIRQEIAEAVNPKTFFNDRVADMHGGGRDQRRQDRTFIETKEKESAFLDRLRQVLATDFA